jgi:GH18 family chitinase
MQRTCTRIELGFLTIMFLVLPYHVVNAGQIQPHKILVTYWSDDISKYTDYPIPGSLSHSGTTQQNPELMGQLDMISVLAYAFLQVDEAGHVYFSHPAVDLSRGDVTGFCRQHTESCPQIKQTSAGSFTAFARLQNTHRTLRKIISIGGAGSQNTFENAIAHPQEFVRSASVIIAAYHLDGIDLDFEPDAFFGPGEGERYAQLVLALRKELGPQAYISIEVPGDWETLRSMDCTSNSTCRNNLERMADNAYVSLMGYDFHGPYYPGGVTGNNSNLYSSPEEPLIPSFYHLSDNQAVEYLAFVGVPVDKIFLGFPAYFVAYGGVETTNSNHGLYVRFLKRETPKYDLNRGYGSYRAAQKLLKSGFKSHDVTVNGRLSAVYAFDPGTRQWISYENPATVTAKANYVICRHLAGMIMWEIGEDEPVRSGISLLGRAHAILFKPKSVGLNCAPSS